MRKKIHNDFDFKSNSDTEVILNLYIKYKHKILDLLEGMYAFVIYDNLEKKIFAARDEFGIKPLYYLFNNEKKYNA